MDYRKQLGYVLKNKDIHICGYNDEYVTIQDKSDRVIKSFKMYDNSKGIYFNYGGKRMYVKKF